MSTCGACGATLAPNKSSGPPRKWCNERCRKSQYSGTCIDCGARLNGSDGRGLNAPVRCRTCSGLANPKIPGRIEKVLEMMRLRAEENLTNKEIGERLATPTATVATELCRLRAIGFDVTAAPYKNARPRGAHMGDRATMTLARELARRGITPESHNAGGRVAA